MPTDLLLESVKSIHESLSGRGASGEPEVNWHNTLAATKDSVREVIVTTTVGTRAHGDDPLGVIHLIVQVSENGCHLVGDGTGDDNNFSLTGSGTWDDTETIKIVTRSVSVHHLDGAAGKTESEGPGGVRQGPLAEIVDCHLSVLEHVVGFGGTEFVHECGFATFLKIDTVRPFGATTGDDGHTRETSA